MFKSHGRVVATCLLLSLVGCQTIDNNGATRKSEVGQLVISEPLAVNFKNEVRLARLSDLLHSEELKPTQRAQAFFERCVLPRHSGPPSKRVKFKRCSSVLVRDAIRSDLADILLSHFFMMRVSLLSAMISQPLFRQGLH